MSRWVWDVNTFRFSGNITRFENANISLPFIHYARAARFRITLLIYAGLNNFNMRCYIWWYNALFNDEIFTFLFIFTRALLCSDFICHYARFINANTRPIYICMMRIWWDIANFLLPLFQYIIYVHHVTLILRLQKSTQYMLAIGLKIKRRLLIRRV